MRRSFLLGLIFSLCFVNGFQAQFKRPNADLATDLERLALELRLPDAPPVIRENLAGALATAPAGSTLQLEGTFQGNYVVPVSLTLTGGRIISPNTGPALTITGNNVRLHNLYIGAVPIVGTQDLLVIRGANALLEDVEVEGNGNTKRGIAANGNCTTLRRVNVHHIGRRGQESQAVAMWDGTCLTVQMSVLKAGSTPLLVGGADPTVPNMIPADIVVENSLLSHHDEWRGAGYVNKTGFELKSARRVVVRNTTIEKVWADGQTAWCITLTPVNQNGNSPLTIVEDVTFENVTCREVGGGANILGFTQETARPTLRLQNVVFRNSTFNISRSTQGGHGSLMQLGIEPLNVSWVGNTVTQDNEAFIRTTDARPINGFVFTGNNVTTTVPVLANIYGIWTPVGSRGGAWVLNVFPGINLTMNTFTGSHSIFRAYFTNNTFQ